jgi:hypothetical protein
MKRLISVSMIGVLSCVAWASAVAQTTAINGHINGIESCFQFLCGYAEFVGTFTGKVNGSDTTGVFRARVTHGDLVETNQGVTTVDQGGEWALILPNTVIKGTVGAGGTLKFHQNNTFAVDLPLLIEGSSSTAMFDGTLNHNVFPPTATGRLRSK